MHEIPTNLTGATPPPFLEYASRGHQGSLDSRYKGFADQAHEHIDGGDFHSPIDQELAHELVDRLQRRGFSAPIDIDTYKQAVDSAVALVPVKGEDGYRRIAGKVLAPGLERRIASRLTSREVDIAAADGSWGRLPEAVKKQTTLYGSEIHIEPASHCTVGCSFCTVAKHGPIEAKMSLESIREVVSYFAHNQDVGYWRGTQASRVDSMYHGSDPFDLKWAASGNTPERDYRDLVRAYREAVRDSHRIVGTTTAVPLGEEWRVLAFGAHELNALNASQSLLRLSVTNGNKERVTHVQNILNILAFNPKHYLAINNVYEHEALRGAKRWERAKDIDLWDIIGPECRDGVIIGVHDVYGIAMEGASEERPTGGPRLPIRTVHENGTRYSVPRHYATPPGYKVKAPDSYPPIALDHYDVDTQGNGAWSVEVQTDNPHRALLRLASGCRYYGQAYQETTDRVRADFTDRFGASAQTIREYLQNGGNNPTMQSLLDTVVKHGLLAQ